jgi:hypothetical protein
LGIHFFCGSTERLTQKKSECERAAIEACSLLKSGESPGWMTLTVELL